MKKPSSNLNFQLTWKDIPISQERFRKLVAQSLEKRRNAVVYHLAEKIAQLLEDNETEGKQSPASRCIEWEKVNSLSRLRSLVGGRFSNIKQKWLAAGFPLQEKNQSKPEPITINQEAWSELAIWIGKQGFESRLAPEGSDYFFEVRSI